MRGYYLIYYNGQVTTQGVLHPDSALSFIGALQRRVKFLWNAPILKDSSVLCLGRLQTRTGEGRGSRSTEDGGPPPPPAAGLLASKKIPNGGRQPRQPTKLLPVHQTFHSVPLSYRNLGPSHLLLAECWGSEMLNNNNNNNTSACDAFIVHLSFSYFILEALRTVPFLHKTSGCIYIKK